MQERVLGTIERYRLRHPVFLHAGPVQVFSSATELMKPYTVDRSFIDQHELDRENIHLNASLERAFRQRSEASVGLSSHREAARWNAVGSRIDDLIDIGAVYNNKLIELESDSPPNMSFIEVAVYHTSALGAELTLRDALREQLALARRAGVEDKFADFTELVDFTSGFISSAKIDGVALEDFADPKIGKKSSVPFFQFLVIAETLAHRRIYDELLQDNEGTLASQYPNHAKWNLSVLSTRVSLFMGHLQARYLTDVARRARQPLADVYRNAARILEGVGVVREKARKALLNPKDPDSAAVREIASVYLKSPLTAERIHLLQILGLNKLSILFTAYRRAYQLASSENGEFYFDLAMVIRDYIEEISSVKDILTDEDIGIFLAGYDEDTLGASPLESQIQLQARCINELVSQTSQRFFEVNPDTIDFGKLVSPQLIEVTLDKNRPRKFTINLVYNNELDEEVEIEYTIDTTKGTFDWNFLEDPENPENTRIAVMRNQLFYLASTLLAEIVSREVQKKLASHSVQNIDEGQTASAKRERFDDPIYILRKQVREEQRALRVQETEEIDITPALRKGSVKNIIRLDGDKITKRMGVVGENTQVIFDSIREYNERGVGKFTRKRKRGPDGRPRYTLRVGDYRVLTSEVESTEGRRDFEIIDIRHRKDVYQRNEL